MKPNKKFASVAAAALAMAGVAVVAAPSANAFTGNLSLGCWVDGISTTVAAYPNLTNPAQNATINHTVNLNGSTGAANVAQGSSIAISYTYSQGPINGGPPQAIGGVSSIAAFAAYTAGPDTIFGTTDDVQVGATVNSAAVLNSVAVAGGSTAAFPSETYTAAFTAPVAGAYQIKVKTLVFTATGLNTYCNGNTFGTTAFTNPSVLQVGYAGTGLTTTGPTVSVSSVTGQTVTTAARSANVINVSLGLFPGAGTLELCDTAGTVCDAAGTGTHDGSIGSLTVAATATTGARAIKATSGATSALAPITILGAPSISLSPAAGGPGSAVTVTGSNFNPNGAASLLSCSVAAFACTGAPGGFVNTGTATVNGSGAFSGTITLTLFGTDSTIKVQGGQGAGPSAIAGSATFSFNADQCTRQVGSATPTTCNTSQNVSATVNPGALTQQTVAGPGVGYTSTLIPLGAVTTATTAGNLPGNINPITVADARGGALGWSLTATMPALTVGASSIANSNLAISGITCAGAGGSATGNTAGPNATFAGTVTLCTKDVTADSAGGTSGGSYLVNGALNLTVPAFQAVGNYTSTITITLT